VQQLAGRDVDAGLAAPGEKLYNTNCASCHGADGTGNTALGAPNLTDNTWLYGGSPGSIKESIRAGRQGRMPAHRDFLGEDKAHVLAAYVYSLGQEAK
jgi:cytochrome c oxidase cbb3-type subunit 3